MPRLLGALAVFALMLFPVLVKADDQKYSLGFIEPGMTIADLRAADWPAGAKLFCGNDEALPEIDEKSRRAIMLTERLKASGVAPCALFGKDDDGLWRPRQIKIGSNPAAFWAIALAGDNGEPAVLAEVRMWQQNEFFAATVAALTEKFGRPEQSDVNAARWINARYEALVAHESKNGIITFLIDNALRSKVIERMAKNSVSTNPQGPHGQ